MYLLVSWFFNPVIFNKYCLKPIFLCHAIQVRFDGQIRGPSQLKFLNTKGTRSLNTFFLISLKVKVYSRFDFAAYGDVSSALTTIVTPAT